jgi:hypothetical protein
MRDVKSVKAEKILKEIKRHGRKAPKPYQGPPDMDFQIQKTTEATAAGAQEKISRLLRELNASTLDDVGPLTTLSGITSN